MKESSLKTFVRETYATNSPVPYLITAQIAIFVGIHIFDLLYEIEWISVPLYDKSIQWLSLPSSFRQFVSQPWSIITYPFLTIGLFNLLFSCLWLYWISKIFLNLLQARQLTFILISSLLLGGVLYLTLGSIGFLRNSPFTSLKSMSMALGALVVSTATLFPFTQMRLIFLGNIKFKYLAIIYIALQFFYYTMTNKTAAATFALVSFYGWLFAKALQRGKDWSEKIKFSKKKKLKIISRNFPATHKNENYDTHPDQETIDRLLDKISKSGYDSLTKNEKDTLFKASQQ